MQMHAPAHMHMHEHAEIPCTSTHRYASTQRQKFAHKGMAEVCKQGYVHEVERARIFNETTNHSLPTPLGRDGIFLENEIDISACNMEKVHVTMVDVRGDDGSVDRLGMLVLVPTCTHMCTHMCIHMRTHMCTHTCILSARGHQIHTCTIQCWGGSRAQIVQKPPNISFDQIRSMLGQCLPCIRSCCTVDMRVHTTGGGASFSVGTDAKKMTVNVWTKGKYKFYDAERYHWRVQYCLIGY